MSDWGLDDLRGGETSWRGITVPWTLKDTRELSNIRYLVAKALCRIGFGGTRCGGKGKGVRAQPGRGGGVALGRFKLGSRRTAGAGLFEQVGVTHTAMAQLGWPGEAGNIRADCKAMPSRLPVFT